jgi:hypothetical protein
MREHAVDHGRLNTAGGAQLSTLPRTVVPRRRHGEVLPIGKQSKLCDAGGTTFLGIPAYRRHPAIVCTAGGVNGSREDP